MKYEVLFQDRVKKMTVDAKSESEASVKAFKSQKCKDKMIVISARLIMLFFAFLLFSSFAQEPDPGPIHLTWHAIVLLVAGFYEVIVRIIPTVSNWSWLQKIIEILLWLSNFLNRKKKK